MKQIYWDIIEESKRGTNFNSEIQYQNLFNLLKDKDEGFIRDFNNEWKSECLGDKYRFEALRSILGGHCDTFYILFGSWLFVQGKDLWDSYIKNGHKVVMDYIESNNISKSNYSYECMFYVFQDLAEHKGYDYL